MAGVTPDAFSLGGCIQRGAQNLTWHLAETAGEMLSLGWEKEDAEPKLVLWREGRGEC